ncbi:MAG: helix-turn-helix transcriptional regulator [Rickettsiales bacterium]
MHPIYENTDRLLRLPEVIRITGLSRATIYRLMKAGVFPTQVKLTTQAVGWRLSQVHEWLASRVVSTSLPAIS